jgi:secreted trypsin-like serine protease
MLIDLDQAVDGAIAAPRLQQGLQLEASAVIAAYGLTERGQMRALRFLATTLQRIDPATTTITVNSGPTAGACGGDSGGPLFVATQDDGWQLAGILSVGSAYCLGEDTFIDVTQEQL